MPLCEHDNPDECPNHGRRVSRFQKPMDLKSVRERFAHREGDNPIYTLAVEATGEQGVYTTDVLSQRLKAILPIIITVLATDIEEENERRGI
jgi:hypothetical protein